MDYNVHEHFSGSECRRRIIRFIDLLGKEIIFGGHLFATGSVSVIMACATVFIVPLSWDILLVSYLLFYVIYLYDYVEGASSDELTNAGRSRYIQCKGKNKCKIAAASFILVISMIIFSNSLTTLAGLCILAMGLLYGNCFKKLTKRIPAFKNIFVSFVWAFMALFVFFYYDLPVTYGVIMLALFIFIRMMNIQILFDVRDVEGDRVEGLLTVPALLGNRNCPYILRSINLLSVIFVFMCVHEGLLPFFALAVIPVFYYASGYIGQVAESRKDHSSYLLAACEPIMWSVLIMAGKYVTMSGVI